MSREAPFASLSLDLDNLWSYLRVHGDASWQELPSYLGTAVPRILDFLSARSLEITFFVVGLDAAEPDHRDDLRAIAAAGHEIGNHSFRHEPWLHLYSRDELAQELDQAHEAIESAIGRAPVGFRGPGFSISSDLLRELLDRGYLYDASTFPTFIGPLARTYYLLSTRGLSSNERKKRAKLFGTLKDGFRPLPAYRWHVSGSERRLVEIPVSTMPGLRVPVHFSYLQYLAGFSRHVALCYWHVALALFRLRGLSPSLLLHPLDFLGREDTSRLDFFPAMRRPKDAKLGLLGTAVDALAKRFEVVTTSEHARRLGENGRELSLARL